MLDYTLELKMVFLSFMILLLKSNIIKSVFFGMIIQIYN